MKDLGIDKGSVKKFETSNPAFKGMFGFRKLFWTYLKKLNVVFSDPCCEDASGDDKQPVAWDLSQGQIVRFDGTNWVPVTAFATTTTTTSTSSTTTTTTVP